MRNPICYCGHDCSRCLTYLATINHDDHLRKQSQKFYRDEFGMDIPLEAIHCLGGRSEDAFYLCRECPWKKCCRERGIAACSDCADYPCEALKRYQDKYVNKCNQVETIDKTFHNKM